MSLSVDQVVRVTAQILPAGLSRKDFGRTLLVSKASQLAQDGVAYTGRVMQFPDMESVAAIAPSESSFYQQAQIYFSQNPFPKNLMLGVHFDAVNWDAGIVSDVAPADLEDFRTQGSGYIRILGQCDAAGGVWEEEVEVNSLNDAQSFDDIASIFTAFIQNNGIEYGSGPLHDYCESMVCIYDENTNRFKMMFAANTTGKDGFKIVACPVAQLGDDLAPLIGLSSTQSPIEYTNPGTSETLLEAMDAIEETDPSFYFVVPSYEYIDIQQDIEDLAGWIAARNYMGAFESYEANCLTGNTSLFQDLHSTQNERVFGVWSGATGEGVYNPKSLSAAARLSSVDFNGQNTLITLKFKQLPGTTPDDLNATQAGHLQAEKINFYSERSGVPMFEEGYTFRDGVWIDVRYWLDWFVNAVQVEAFNALYSNPTKLPQTEEGMAVIRETIVGVCKQGVANGGLAPGQLSPQLASDVRISTGNPDFDGFLTDGYLVYSAPVVTLPQSERDQRKVPPFKVWLKGAGAIHFLDIGIIFEN